MSMALVLPGQGSQAVGMGKALASDFAMARGVFEEIDAALGQKLSRLMFEGPESELTLTANAQPALMAVSLAALRVLKSEAGRNVARDANFAAGHSLANIRRWPQQRTDDCRYCAIAAFRPKPRSSSASLRLVCKASIYEYASKNRITVVLLCRR